MNDTTAIDGLTVIAIFSDVVIAAGYVLLGALIAKKFDAAAPTWVLNTFKLAGLTFFVTCALTHLHHAEHVARNIPDDSTSVHFLFIHGVQAVAAIVAGLIGWSFISLRIYDRSYYGPFLDRAIDREANQIALRVQLHEVETIANEAKRVSDMAEMMRGVYSREEAV